MLSQGNHVFLPFAVSSSGKRPWCKEALVPRRINGLRTYWRREVGNHDFWGARFSNSALTQLSPFLFYSFPASNGARFQTVRIGLSVVRQFGFVGRAVLPGFPSGGRLFSRLWPPKRRLRPRLAALQNQTDPLPRRPPRPVLPRGFPQRPGATGAVLRRAAAGIVRSPGSSAVGSPLTFARRPQPRARGRSRIGALALRLLVALFRDVVEVLV